MTAVRDLPGGARDHPITYRAFRARALTSTGAVLAGPWGNRYAPGRSPYPTDRGAWATPSGLSARTMFPFRNAPELLATFRAGERDALETVYRFYVRPLDVYFRSLARRTGNSELSQPSAVSDLLQETFIRAFSHDARHAYDGVRDYGPYLYTIARNCFLDTLRKRRKETPLSPEDLPLSADGEDAACAEAYDAETLAVLEAYLRDLPLPLKRVYEKRFELGLTQEAACGALGISRRKLRTAEDHLRRGVRKALMLARLRGPQANLAVGSLETERR